MKILFILLFIFLFLATDNVSAKVDVVSSSASFKTKGNTLDVDNRVSKLSDFFENYKSPLAPFSDEFIYWADYYNLDWRLIPAISGVESTFGKNIPKSSFNAYGWANGNYKFTSWENSIEIVAKTLREKYYNQGANNIDRIAKRYAPPSHTWAWKVKFFMEKIDPTPVEFDL
ncbi:MAG: hypothetical protein US60_C0008G0007 [Microgenomates group bacterium GW2011_GWC1_37_8]|uniref:Mannosyl-glycoprotein endo-beta-N-acetylglucosamidase-like domain-containing protein n=1 Tax=Candidatus Woesebacteria bacterium GW2011_GWB1_38_8 TaxID=1618570 RepID=A0A0G0NIW8_9BACT|nr:MAG: hypothetical protein US60_C0008G0007 [Microgenomates group bacterium GW2011_GWC1_37_8]KKQ85844.1 MAG: hypothetical protein UT08_C0003G0007 [Candidatus Woesebacteria bacterium GW2011_GWB1_38_8]